MRRLQRGALLIEVLVAVFVCAFALLGFASLQARATTTEFEALQRSQALVLVDDMLARINANRAHAADYLAGAPLGSGAMANCAGLNGAALDLCEWANLIRGNAEQRGGAAVGAMLGARGCITRASSGSDRYVVAVAWQGVIPTAGSPAGCAQGDAAFPNEALRRAVASTLCVGRLRDVAATAGVARC